MAKRIPKFPQFVCPGGEEGACGFTPAGVGFKCREGDACGKTVQPGEPGCAELRAYDRAMTAAQAGGDRG